MKVLACVSETGFIPVSNQFLQGGPHEIHRVHELQPGVDVDLLFVVGDDCVHQDVLVEGYVFFLVAGDTVNVTREVIPGQVVKEDGNGPRSLQPKVALGVESASVSSRVMAIVSNISIFHH